MTTLVVGFDSAWTSTNSGGIVAVLRHENGSYLELGPPQIVNYVQAERLVLHWQAEHSPTSTIILLDQPTIVTNATGQRPVENLAASPVSLRYGGMQPANTARTEMFGVGAPVWPFLARFGGVPDPLAQSIGTGVFETYPVLAMIAFGWMMPDPRSTGRLPKYNPERKATFALVEWRHVCTLTSNELRRRGLPETAEWLDGIAQKAKPRKPDQDGLDACLCLLVALYVADGDECLMVGDMATGYIVVPYEAALHAELCARCEATGRAPTEWLRKFRSAP